METPVQKPVLVTLTGGTASGKSYLFNYIRDVAKLPCLISTTTRASRLGERDGIDYFFISAEESERLEREDQFAELAVYNGARYGVTKSEFHSKLSKGITFLICEPSGIEHYAQPAIDVGALHFKVFVHTEPDIRLQRFRDRAAQDMMRALTYVQDVGSVTRIMKEFNTSMNRLTSILTEEIKWSRMHQWDRMVFGDKQPEENLQIIMNDIKMLQALELEGELGRARIHNQYQLQQYAESRQSW